MERLTRRNNTNLATPILAYEKYTEERPLDCANFCDVQDDCAECAIGTCFDKLADYEDAEEQGRLIELPVAVGDTLYYVPDWLYDKCIDELTVTGYALLNSGKSVLIEIKENEPKQHLIKDNLNANMIGKSVFRTKEEAAAKLKELEDKNG